MYTVRITVAQRCSLYMERTEKVRIWDCDSDKAVFEGACHEAEQCPYAGQFIESFNIEDGLICFNI